MVALKHDLCWDGVFLSCRFKVKGPDGSNYFVSHETQVGGSDPDDA